MKIDINKKYRTRDGREVTHLHRAPEGWSCEYPWRGQIADCDQTWTDDGKYQTGTQESRLDLIEVREPREFRLWVAENGDTATPNHRTDTLPQRSIDAGWREIRVREIID